MRYLMLFEELKVRKKSRILKHFNSGKKDGVDSVVGLFGVDLEEDPKLDVLGDIFDSLSKRFKLDKKIKYLDSGQFGMAFVTDDNKIIKLTSSKNEADQVKTLIGKNVDHVVRYYDVVYMKKYGVYAILMDRAEKLSRDEKTIVKVLGDGDEFFSLGDLAYVGSLKNISRSKIRRVFNDHKKMIKSLNDNDISLYDLHTGNIGYLNGEMVVFDMMSETSLNDVEKISKVKVKLEPSK
jgi:hypothetical protein